MKLHFSKYQGTGNDFVLVDGFQLSKDFSLSTAQIKFICDRRFGVGADGLMILRSSEEVDFYMDYYNADGNQSSMCGNGGRCISKFAFDHGLIKSQARFMAIDGLHSVEIFHDSLVSLTMNHVTAIKKIEEAYILDTGSPHYVQFVNQLDDFDIYKFGREIRYGPTFREKGVNVNLVEIIDDTTLKMQTYERGVEDETLSCGTGMVAAAVSFIYSSNQKQGSFNITLHTQGGNAQVAFDICPTQNFHNIRLIGPAMHVFDGVMEI